MYFKANFEIPEDLFIHLTEHFSEIIIEKDTLRFRYTIGKKKLVRDVAIQLEKKEEEDLALAHLEITKIKKQF